MAPNRRLFAFAQIAGPQTGACLASRRLQGLKQAPVWHYTKCRTLNRHLFAFAQASAEAEEVYPGTRPNFPAPAGALFAFAQASAEAEGVYPGTRPNFPAPAGALFWLPKLLRFENGIVVRERYPRRSGERLLRGRDPIKISAGCLLLRPTKVFE